MTKNKKHKGTVAQAQPNSTINDMAQPDKALFNGDLFGKPTKSGSANVAVSGADLLDIVVSQYSKLAHKPTMPMPKTEADKTEFVAHMAKNHHAVMPNGYMAFDVVFLARLHSIEIDTSNYKKGCGLQSYITAIGSTRNKNGVPHGLCAKLQNIGFIVIENQYVHDNTKHFLGRMWVICKPQPKA